MYRLSQLIRHGIAHNTLNSGHFCRTLYSLNSLGVDKFLESREKVKQYFGDTSENFRLKMNEFLNDSKGSLIFTEDLKHMIHLAEHNERDFELLGNMLRKFNKQNKEVRFGNFIFGPVVMRLCCHLKNSDVALSLFKDPELDGFFDQMVSYQILCDMLFEDERYQDVIDVYSLIRAKQSESIPNHVVVLVSGACYKLNTPESFQFLCDLWEELKRVGHMPMRRAVSFFAALALKQNAPHIALELAGSVKKQSYVTIRNLKVLALAELGRAEDALPILRSVLEVSDPSLAKHTFAMDVVGRLKEIITAGGDKELLQNFSRIEKFLVDSGHIDTATLDEHLTIEIKTNFQNNMRSDRNFMAASYNNYMPDRRPRARPGLHELE